MTTIKLDGEGRDLTPLERVDMEYMLVRSPQVRFMIERGKTPKQIADAIRKVLPRFKVCPDEDRRH